MSLSISQRELEVLEAQVMSAFQSGHDTSLEIMGYGESSVVLKLETDRGTFACKRLPTFPDQDRFNSYRRQFTEYLQRLKGAGLKVVDSDMRSLTLPSGEVAAYCVQRALPAGRLCSTLLQSEDENWARQFFVRFLDAVDCVVAPTLGFDAQASNWFYINDDLLYLDVTTPFMRDAHGGELLDVRLFVNSLPWIVRHPIRLSMTKRILDKYYSTRGVILDFLGNLHKESLGDLVPLLLKDANARLSQPISRQEVARYYTCDAITWKVLQGLRRADRLWQHNIRRRPYRYLLPPS